VKISQICPANILEERQHGESPLQYCQRLATEKSQAKNFPNAIVLAADTIVTQADLVYEKPIDDLDALRILLSLQGTWHEVITAWAIYNCNSLQCIHGHAISGVRFRSLTQNECEAYIQTQEGKDKAGGYGIQGLGAALVSEIRGSYSNIVGLPMEQIIPQLQQHLIF